MDVNEIEKVIRGILAERVPGLKAEDIAPQAELSSLGLDSLAFSWVLADLEEAFDIVMQGSDILHLKTLAAAVEYVAKRLQEA